ncbi:MAG: hypothetical protein M1281_00555 [Chloroflexi bacterium]|nr:hypothetical protein [Chloroflexota bacterium]
MAKEFYTERDIEDMVKRGVQSLELTDDVVLTELAYERASRLGLKLVREHDNPPSAPVRPYIAKAAQVSSSPSAAPLAVVAAAPAKNSDLKKRIHDAAIARLGGQVDPVLLDTIIDRVLNSVGVK